MVPRFKFDPHTPYFQLLVPTVDTTRYAFLLGTCLQVRPLCLCWFWPGCQPCACMLHRTLNICKPCALV